ncbi:hypothetical protein DZF91_37755 [Actinomadura logoneensis]|uniref:Uncharacterized protein n=1 Tax=Actinomadura logoneensis TaxID=2293572 RepID=A0A372JAW4_9ACTN|nr:hypothetical protein DZF91_37755 [Actinomadura logoneensis]
MPTIRPRPRDNLAAVSGVRLIKINREDNDASFLVSRRRRGSRARRARPGHRGRRRPRLEGRPFRRQGPLHRRGRDQRQERLGRGPHRHDRPRLEVRR